MVVLTLLELESYNSFRIRDGLSLFFSPYTSDISTIKQLSSDVLFKVLSFSIKLIKIDTILPEELPKGVASRHRICTNLGQIIKVRTTTYLKILDITIGYYYGSVGYGL